LAGIQFQVVVEQHLLARFAVPEKVADALDAHHRLLAAVGGKQDLWDRRRSDGPSCRQLAGTHQNTSAGSACCTLRSASRPDRMHISTVSTRMRAMRPGVKNKEIGRAN